MAQKVICVHSTWLWKEKKSSHHICDANYAVRGPRKPVAHLLLPEKSFRRSVHANLTIHEAIRQRKAMKQDEKNRENKKEK